jgi:hypothetical protein
MLVMPIFFPIMPFIGQEFLCLGHSVYQLLLAKGIQPCAVGFHFTMSTDRQASFKPDLGASGPCSKSTKILTSI